MSRAGETIRHVVFVPPEVVCVRRPHWGGSVGLQLGCENRVVTVDAVRNRRR